MAGSTYDFPVSLTNNKKIDVNGPVTFIRYHSGNGTLRVIVDNKVSELVSGQAIRSDTPITAFEIENRSGGTVDGIFKLGHGAEITDNNLSGTVGISKPTVIDTVPDVALGAASTTLILAADATRQEALITNLIGNPNAIRLGDLNTAAARGAQCGIGVTATIRGTEAIYGYSAGALSVGVTVVKD